EGSGRPEAARSYRHQDAPDPRQYEDSDGEAGEDQECRRPGIALWCSKPDNRHHKAREHQRHTGEPCHEDDDARTEEIEVPKELRAQPGHHQAEPGDDEEPSHAAVALGRRYGWRTLAHRSTNTPCCAR